MSQSKTHAFLKSDKKKKISVSINFAFWCVLSRLHGYRLLVVCGLQAVSSVFGQVLSLLGVSDSVETWRSIIFFVPVDEANIHSWICCFVPDGH